MATDLARRIEDALLHYAIGYETAANLEAQGFDGDSMVGWRYVAERMAAALRRPEADATASGPASPRLPHREGAGSAPTPLCGPGGGPLRPTAAGVGHPAPRVVEAVYDQGRLR